MNSHDESSNLIFTREAPVREAIAVVADLLIATLDKRAHEQLADESRNAGIGAFDLKTGEPRWTVWGVPPLTMAKGDTIYAYSRAGLIIAFGLDGVARWRTNLPDDRSAAAARRGDRDSPFVGDVVVRDSALFVAAGSEIVKLSTADGSILGKEIICYGNRAAVSRMAAGAKGDLVATCTTRTPWDDEEGSPPLLWSTPPPLARHRIASGDTVVLSEELTISHRIPAPDPSFAHLDYRPVLLDDGSIALVGAKILGEGGSRQLGIFEGWLFVLEADTGRVRWHRQIEHSGPPVAAGSVVFTGLASFSIVDGCRLWQSSVGLSVFDSNVPPIFDGERLLFVDRGAIRAFDLYNGTARDVVRFAPRPFHGRPTTILVTAGENAFIGISEAGKPTMLLGILTSG
jgi:PQQ-like domain